MMCLIFALLWSTAVHSLHLPLVRRAPRVIPVPISFGPSSYWDGIDGRWNSFSVRVGTPQKVCRLHASTTDQQTWVVDTLPCAGQPDAGLQEGCEDQRGGAFNYNESSTFTSQGTYELFLEKNLNYTGAGRFGLDTVGLGLQGEGGPTLDQQLVAVYHTQDFYYGLFGLHPKTTNLTDLNQNIPSFMSTLKAKKLIPSVSWGFTQGAEYRFSKVYASLTLGGFDTSRFIRNNVNFPLKEDTDRDIVVNINGISFVTGSNSTPTSLLPRDVYAFVDSTVAEIWLPKWACDQFERAFNLAFDPVTQLYLIDDATHRALSHLSPNITFTLSPTPPSSGSSTVAITLPYAAFDLTARPPYRNLTSNRRYFPLRRAANLQQITLGRTFLQEAYLIVDWERQNFSVSQVAWIPNAEKKIAAITPPGESAPSENAASEVVESAPALGNGSIIGIAVSIFIVSSIIATLSFLLWRANRRKREEARAKKVEDLETSGSDSTNVHKAELDASEESSRPVFEKDAPIVQDELHEAPENVIFELPGDEPPNPEADGRELSEKEAMMVREQRYNGLETRPAAPAAPLAEKEALAAPPPPPLDALATAAAAASPPRSATTKTTASRSPVSPVTPRDADGPFSPVSPVTGTMRSAGSGAPAVAAAVAANARPAASLPRDARQNWLAASAEGAAATLDGRLAEVGETAPAVPLRRKFSFEG